MLLIAPRLLAELQRKKQTYKKIWTYASQKLGNPVFIQALNCLSKARQCSSKA